MTSWQRADHERLIDACDRWERLYADARFQLVALRAKHEAAMRVLRAIYDEDLPADECACYRQCCCAETQGEIRAVLAAAAVPPGTPT